ncbi:MAG TPA: class I SAM-dependent methyltransferase, partial [Stellaceae bacterium]|nr:class I SAM-dependent methyltransferase [Stellaceae bacterium]
MRQFTRSVLIVLALAGIAAPHAARSQAAPDYAAIVAAPDRSAADRENDKRRAPEKVLAFSGVRTGWTVLDMGAGAGYDTELFARAVGPTGKVYAQDSAEVFPRPQKAWEERAKSPAMANVTHVTRPYDDPVPPDVKNLDLVTFFYFYHDTTYMKVDRAKMDKALFDALKPGGYLVIADYAAAKGAGTSVGKTFHRIEESTLISEVEAAGFKKVDEGDFLRNPNDPHNMPIFHPT